MTNKGQSLMDRLQVSMLGTERIQLIRDTAFFLEHKPTLPRKEFTSLQQSAKQQYKRIVISGGCLSLALMLSLTRYLPNTFGTFSTAKLLAESTIVAIGLSSTTALSIMTVEPSVLKLKRETLLGRDEEDMDKQGFFPETKKISTYVLQYLVENQVRFGLSLQQQANNVLNDKEHVEWSGKVQSRIRQLASAPLT